MRPLRARESVHARRDFRKFFGAVAGHFCSDRYIAYGHNSLQDGGVSKKKGGAKRHGQTVGLNTSWAVGHSSTLLRMFACLINVELSFSLVSGIRYLRKEMYRKSDRLTVEIVPNSEQYDDIDHHEGSRYLFASEEDLRLSISWVISHG